HPSYVSPCDLPSFPTRRSSDLDALGYLVRFHRDRIADRGSVWYFVFHGPTLDPWVRGGGIVHVITIVPAIVLVVALAVLTVRVRSEEHTSELQSRENLVCRLLL